MTKTPSTPITILLIHFDWRNIFEHGFEELTEKLVRDRFVPEVNRIYSFAWSTVSYEKEKNGIHSRHVKTHLRFFRPLLDFFSRIMVPRWVAQRGITPDVVMVYDFGLLPAARAVAKKTGARVVLIINNMPVKYSLTRRFGRIKSLYSFTIERLFWRRADAFFTINPAMAAYLKGIGIPEERIRMFAMNTIERDAQHIAASKKGVVRSLYAIPADARIMITVARLEAEKDHVRLLELFAALPASWHLILLGDGSLKQALMEQAIALGIDKRVIFAGFVKRSMIWNYYQDADVFTLLSKAEALGVVFWEAMYMRVPVIGSMAEGIVESIGENEERGQLIGDEEGRDAFIEAVKICTDPGPKREQMLQGARDYVESHIANSLTINDVVASL